MSKNISYISNFDKDTLIYIFEEKMDKEALEKIPEEIQTTLANNKFSQIHFDLKRVKTINSNFIHTCQIISQNLQGQDITFTIKNTSLAINRILKKSHLNSDIHVE